MNISTNNFENFKSNLFYFISDAIKRNISGSVIADTLVNMGMNREAVLKAIALVGTKMNMEDNPNISWQEAFKAYAF